MIVQIEQKWFGKWAHAFNDRTMQHKAYVTCDPTHMWFAILGNDSYDKKPVTYVDKNLSELKLPPLVRPASETQRRYFLKIIQEALSHVLESVGTEYFSGDLFEFILRAAFTFTSTGELRMAAARATKEEKADEFASNIATQLTGKKRLSKNDDTEEVCGSAYIGSAATGTKATPGDEVDGSATARGSVGSATTMGSVIHRPEHPMGHRLTAESGGMEATELRTLVKEMFAPDIFEDALSVEDLQLNLTMVHTSSEPNLRRWLRSFEEECGYQRALRVQGLNENRRELDTDPRFSQGMRTNRGVVIVHEKDDDDIEKVVPLQKYSRRSGKFKVRQKSVTSVLSEVSAVEESESEDSADGLHPFFEAGVQVELDPEEALHQRILESCGMADKDVERDESGAMPDPTSSRLSTSTGLRDSTSSTGSSVLEMKAVHTTLAPDSMRIQERWVRWAASLIHNADVSAAKVPATYALMALHGKEQHQAAEAKKLGQEIQEARHQLTQFRQNARSQQSQGKGNQKREREDLDWVTEAIGEAKSELAQLQTELEELQSGKAPDKAKSKPMTPSTIGRSEPEAADHEPDSATINAEPATDNGTGDDAIMAPTDENASKPVPSVFNRACMMPACAGRRG
jgi:hypothetical protein